ncbi:hypothetical protein NIES2100_01190 [Calothrix sp. NIES-2100]|uniref:glycosyltransferase family 39 protein n=1 Tax=Calothrix sp. NIES-2100 TaxID=1954172 RepID=UPI000B612BF3|nr:hypothetical protein NIES2100_01190 [Calothrix sp. NIES-2100]
MNIISRVKHQKTWLLVILLIIALGVRLPGLYSRAISYDEAITLLETAGNVPPSWPYQPVPASEVQKQFKGTPTLSKIAEYLRQTDVHPPFYFWLLSLWRRWLGFSIETSRIFSVVCSLGNVLVLYLVLQAGQIERPLIPCLVFAISSSAIFAGHDTRPYALASLLIGMGTLFAYLATEAKNRNKTRLVVYSTAMALCCGLAFLTNYLSLFPIGIILLWFTINLWFGARLLAILSPLMAISICLTGLQTWLTQLNARPDQSTGFLGFFREIAKIISRNLFIIWTPAFTNKELKLVLMLLFIVVVLILIGLSIAAIQRYYSQTNRKLLLLFIGLAVAPSIGIFLLDFISKKNLHGYRYFFFAVPALSVLITYGITKPIFSQKVWIRYLLPILLCIQLTGVNWGLETIPSQTGSNFRSLARTIKASSSSHVVVVGNGFGRGHPGAVIYELAPETMIVVLSKNSNLEKLQRNIQNYQDVWIVPSSERPTASIEKKLLNLIQTSQQYTSKPHQDLAVHFQKRL